MSTLSHPDQFKALSHPLRLAILRRLLRQPATLSQLGAQFGESPAHIRHHLKGLEQVGLVEPSAPPAQHNHLEKYYTAAADGWLVQFPLLPAPEAGQINLVIGSKDAATRLAAADFAGQSTGLSLHLLALNSLDGLAMLRQGLCQMATCHLPEPDAAAWNRAYVRHWFPGEEMALLRLFAREEGLMIAPGNPRSIHGLADLPRGDIKLINRERGAGVRVWLDQALTAAGIATTQLPGYHDIAASHEAVAQAIAAGHADVGLGLATCARAAGLDFIPLFEEPYDLALPAELLRRPVYAPFFDYLASGQFRRSVGSIAGYLTPPQATGVELIH